MKYLVKITPLEPYAFGDDRNFVYPGEKSTGKETYFVRSKNVPEQTSILGLLRYLILQENGLLKTDFTYSPDERLKMRECIGERSFTYLETEPQDFGWIKEVSPVFLVNANGEILVKNPFHNKAEACGYEPMPMEHGIETSHGVLSLPKAGEYDAKNGYARGYINLTTKEIRCDLFETKAVSGNRKNEKNGSDDGAFFKRELKALKDGYSFAVFTEAEKLPEKVIGYMGKKKSAFLIEATRVESTDLEQMVKECFSEGDTWFYALSDIVLLGEQEYKEFCIVEEKYQRNLETVHDADNRLKRLRKSEIRHHLIQSGSVFYGEPQLNLDHKNAAQIGYNRIVRLGGN